MRAGDMLAAIRALPLATAEEFGAVLVLAPHQDDESLGCGGLIGLLSEAGQPPAILFVTDGALSHPASASFPPDRLRRTREREALDATAILGVPAERVRFLGVPDGAAPRAGDEFDEAVAEIRAVASEFGCSTVLAPWWRDPHCDHEAVDAMARASGLRVLSYPVWGWLLPPDAELAGAPAPDGVRVAIQTQLERKRRAIAAHVSQAGGLIDDDPSGFRLPQSLLDACTTPFEFFLSR